MKAFKTIVLTFVFSLLALGLSACNTVQGVGKDISAGGKALQNASGEGSSSTTTKRTTTTTTPSGTTQVTTTTSAKAKSTTPVQSQTQSVTY